MLLALLFTGLYILFAMVLLSLEVMCTVIILNYHHSPGLVPVTPARRFLVRSMAPYLRIKPMYYSDKTRNKRYYTK